VKRLIAVVLSSLFAGIALPSLAGVAPNHGASQYERSGAKIAPAKPATEEKKENQEDSKELAK